MINMSLPSLYRQHNVTVYRQGKTEFTSVPVVIEVPLTVFLNNTEHATLVCSPGNLEELVVGFLFSEGLVQSRADLVRIVWDEDNSKVWVDICPGRFPETFPEGGIDSNITRKITAWCLEHEQLQVKGTDTRFAASDLLRLISLLDEQSTTFRLTGGVHSAAMANSRGLLVRYEDIGRHNAVDRVLGHLVLNQVTPEDKCLVLSGRVAAEILIKAARGGFPLILSRSAPTMLALEIAQRLGITVVGFARGQQFSVYSHAERVIL